MPEMTIDSVRPSQAGELWMILLRAREGDRHLCIWTRAAEGIAIQTRLQDITLPRPMTHDLLRSVIDATGGKVNRVSISDIVDDTFYARVILQGGDAEVEVDARPSDAIALAVRSQSPIFAEETVLAAAGIEIDSTTGVLEVAPEGHGFLRQTPLFGSTGEVYVSPEQIHLFGLKTGDSLTVEVWSHREGEHRSRLGSVREINGQIPAVTHDLSLLSIPMTLDTPAGWQPMPGAGSQSVNISPGDKPGEIGISVAVKRLSGLTSQQVLDQALEESDGSFQLVEEEDAFQLPVGFAATALVRTVRQISTQGEPDKLLNNWMSLEGATTRWVIGQIEGNAVIVVLEAVDWSKGREVEPLLSRIRLVSP